MNWNRSSGSRLCIRYIMDYSWQIFTIKRLDNCFHCAVHVTRPTPRIVRDFNRAVPIATYHTCKWVELKLHGLYITFANLKVLHQLICYQVNNQQVSNYIKLIGNQIPWYLQHVIIRIEFRVFLVALDSAIVCRWEWFSYQYDEIKIEVNYNFPCIECREWNLSQSYISVLISTWQKIMCTNSYWVRPGAIHSTLWTFTQQEM